MKVLVCAEARQNQLDRLFYELVTAARSVAEGGEVLALWIGADDETPKGQMGSADRVLVVADPRFVSATADIYATALHHAIEAEKPDLTIVGYTAAGMDFGPETATRARLPMAANVVELQRNANGVSIGSQIYGGKMIARLQASGAALVMVSPGAYGEAPSGPLDSSRISKLDLGSTLEFGKIELIEETAPALADVDLTTAERIVSVGRGIGEEKNIDSACELSRLLGAEIAGSRPVVDSGWLPKARQVGKSGQKVRPKLYLALGVSGAPEHLEGMKGAELIVAVNTDAEAPIFSVAHYSATCDLFEFIDSLTERLNELGTA